MWAGAGGNRRHLRGISAVIGVAWLVALVVLCLTPTPGEVPGGIWREWFPEYAGIADFLLNIFLFVPGGAVLAGLTGFALPGLVGGALLSIGIEILQLWIPGRHTSFPDVVANSLGAWIGAYAIVRAGSWFAPVASASRKFALGWLAIAVAALALVGPMTSPTSPEATLYSGWTPQLMSFEEYGGEVLTARIGDLPLPNGGPIAEELQSHLKSLLRAAEEVEVIFLAGPPPFSLVPILRVAGADGNEALLVGADGDDLVVRRRYLADNLRFDRPDLRVRGALSAMVPGDTVRVLVARDSSGWDLVTINGTRNELGFSPARGWSLFEYRSAFPESLVGVLDLFWLFALAFPFGWWARSALLLVAGSAGMTGALLLVPLLGGFVPGNAFHAVVLVAGGLSGWLLRRVVTCPPDGQTG